MFSLRKLKLITYMASLSFGGQTILVLAIASEVFSLDTSGHANSLIYAITLASVAFVGVFGSHVINQSAPNLLGVTIALLSSSFILASIFAPANIAINYLVIFLVGLLNGLENPNNMRVFSALLEDKDKAYFFSFYQTIAQTINIISSAVGAYIINVNGIALAKVIAIILFAFSSLPWIIFYKKIKQDAPVGDGSNKSFYQGYNVLYSNDNIFRLTLSRLLLSTSFITFITLTPLFIANITSNQTDLFVNLLGWAQSAVAMGFVLFSIIGTYVLKKYPKLVIYYTTMASLVGFICVIASNFIASENIFILLCFVFGAGAYFFRVSGMTIGQAITPKDDLGCIIIAGDSIVRGVSIVYAVIASLIAKLAIMNIYLYDFFLIVFVSCSLLSPVVFSPVIRFYKEKHRASSQ